MMSIRLDWTPAQLEAVRVSAWNRWADECPYWFRRVRCMEWARTDRESCAR
jgi:hypothetical protein